MNRVAVIGIDGADLRLIEPWASTGQLPTFARLMQQGVVGLLRSTIRPESSVAWSTFATGLNPGRHGIFGFVGLQPGSYQYRVNNAHNVHGHRFWQWAGATGKRVLVLNVPMTYPPEPVNGALVAGMLTPSLESNFTYPPELKHELKTIGSGYVIDIDKTGVNDGEYIQQLIHSVKQRSQAIQYLARTRDWELLVAVFTETDRLQHFFWADMDKEHPLHTSTVYSEAILQVYQAIDAALEQILLMLGDDGQLWLVSDHGFNGCARRFYVNTWLYHEGFLKLTDTRHLTGRLEAGLQNLRRIRWIRAFKQRLPGLRNLSITHTLQQQALFHLVDWGKTRAFFSEEGGLRINVRGREPCGVVSPGVAYEALRTLLIEQLLALRDPLTGKSVVSAVHRREELYTGPYTIEAPDLIVEPQRDNPKAEHNFILASHASSLLDTAMFDWSLPYTANHTLEGILIAYAKHIMPARRHSGARIEDIAPTVLAALGISIPDTMDGRVLEELFESGTLQTQFVESPVALSTGRREEFTSEEAEKIRSRLQDLGYLG
ncbi:MAG TPA: alkaline phosphatase family protein [Anaerolineae bacterium]|nr:alkaline phosphatase family protein [Anaerolineae bacterium]HQK14382.1 alkaline phosphatase family protein [Anaerolineae bacterium]